MSTMADNSHHAAGDGQTVLVPAEGLKQLIVKVLERQGGFEWMDTAPRTLASSPHRPAYGSDGDYFSKPNREQIVEAVHGIMHQVDPARFPEFL